MPYTRVTVIGSRRTADLVLPDDQPVGTLTPQLLDLLAEEVPAGHGVDIAMSTGQVLDPASTLEELEVAQGAMMQVVSAEATPQAPHVADVTVALGAAIEERRDAWGSRASTVTLAVLSALAAGTGVHFLLAGGIRGWQPVLAVLVIATLLAVVTGRRGASDVAGLLTALSLGITAPLVVGLMAGAPLLAVVAGTLAALWAVLGIARGAGVGSAAVGAGALTGVLIAGGIAVLALQGAWSAGAAAITLTICLVALGLLPGLALSISGLTRYDDLSISGEAAPWGGVQHAISQAYGALTWVVIALAAPIAITVQTLLGLSRWGTVLAAAAILVTLLRTRMFPLVIPRVALLLAVLAPAAAWLVTTGMISDGIRPAILMALAAACGLLAVLPIAPVAAARMRRHASTLELLAMLAVVPGVLGVLGIFDDLFQVFR